MEHKEIFYSVFALQIVVISVVIPQWIRSRLQNLMQEHPPAEYPKLYPVSPERIKTTLSSFTWLNVLVVLMGLSLLAHVIVSDHDELMGWDNQGALIVYFLTQYLPFFYLGSQGFRFHQLMRQLNPSSERTASLSPRNFSDFVSMRWLIAIAISFLVYVGTVFYMAQNPFDGFAGYWNILYAGLLNVFFFILIKAQIHGKKHDPHQTLHDRLQQQRLISQVIVIGWLMANVFLVSNMWLAKLEMRDLNVVIQSLYFTLITLLMSQTSSYQPTDYSVYQNHKEEAI